MGSKSLPAQHFGSPGGPSAAAGGKIPLASLPARWVASFGKDKRVGTGSLLPFPHAETPSLVTPHRSLAMASNYCRAEGGQAGRQGAGGGCLGSPVVEVEEGGRPTVPWGRTPEDAGSWSP